MTTSSWPPGPPGAGRVAGLRPVRDEAWSVGWVLEQLACDRPGCACQAALRRGKGATHCPCDGHANDDGNPSLSVWVDAEGMTTWDCKTGLHTWDEVRAELAARRLASGSALAVPARRRGRRKSDTPPRRPDLTLEQLAEYSMMPLGGLQLHGCRTVAYGGGGSAVEIPYFDLRGDLVRNHYRLYLDGENRFRWGDGDRFVLYGLHLWAAHGLLAAALRLGFLLLPEGETSTWTAWLYGLPALGIPSSSYWDKVRDSLPALPAELVLVPVQDPDDPGEKLCREIMASHPGALVIKPEHDLSDLHKNGVDIPAEVFRLIEEAKHEAALAVVPTSSWLPQNVIAALSDELELPEPTLLRRSDGLCLFYPGRIHDIHGEPESGKTWIALTAAKEVLMAGGRVLYLDFDKDDLKERLAWLQGLGVPKEVLLEERFDYVAPTELKGLELLLDHIPAQQPQLIVIDGVDPLMTLLGLSIDDPEGFEKLKVGMLVPLIRASGDAPLVLLDHVVKDLVTRGRWAAGSRRKLGAVDVSLEIQNVEPFGRGRAGVSSLRISKDRPGALRARQDARQYIGRFQLSSNEDGTEVRAEVLLPAVTDRREEEARKLRFKVSRALEAPPFGEAEPRSMSWIEKEVGGRSVLVRRAVQYLARSGYLRVDESGRYPTYRSQKPYRLEAEGDDEEDE